MPNLIDQIQTCTGLSDAHLGVALARRAGYAPASAHEVAHWRSGQTPMPTWAERTCVQWIVELWRADRDDCNAQQLWQVDQKYTRMLGDFTVADLMRMIRGGQTTS
jgi:hypothetical protein